MEFTLIYPGTAIVLLTAAVLVWMAFGRVAAVREGCVDARFFKTFQGL